MKPIQAVFLIIFALTLEVSCQKNETQYMRLKRLKCEVNSELVYDNITCFAKAFNRTSTGVNFKTYLKKPLGFFFEFIAYYRYGTIFRQVLKLPRVDHCWVAKIAKHNPLIMAVVDILKALEPTLVHECPYTSFIVDNKPVVLKSLPAIFAAGEYKFTIELLTKKDQERIFLVEALATWYSSERNSFG